MKKSTVFFVTGAAVAVTILAWRATNAGVNSDNSVRIDPATVKNLKRFGETVERCRESATAAFSANDGAEHETLDEKAIAEIKQIGELFTEIRGELPDVALNLAREIVERYENAQVQLMAFAINRKNRETDGGPTDLELADRAAFARDSANLSDRLSEAISSRRL